MKKGLTALLLAIAMTIWFVGIAHAQDVPPATASGTPEVVQFHLGTVPQTIEMPTTLEGAQNLIRGMANMLEELNTAYVTGNSQVILDVKSLVTDVNFAKTSAQNMNTQVDTILAQLKQIDKNVASVGNGFHRVMFGPLLGIDDYGDSFHIPVGAMVIIPFNSWLGSYSQFTLRFPTNSIIPQGNIETGILFMF